MTAPLPAGVAALSFVSLVTSLLVAFALLSSVVVVCLAVEVSVVDFAESFTDAPVVLESLALAALDELSRTADWSVAVLPLVTWLAVTACLPVWLSALATWLPTIMPATVIPATSQSLPALYSLKWRLVVEISFFINTFSRKIYCGNCQKLFKRQSRSGKVCWGCQTHIKGAKDCPVKSIREDALHLAFCTMVNKLIFSQKFLLEPLVEQLQADQNQEQAAKLSQVETELKEAKDKQDNLQQLRKQELIEKDFFTKQDAELEQEIANLQSEIERLKQLLGDQNSKLPLTHELLKLCQRSNYLTAFNAELFEQIIESITVDQDHNLTFHLKCGLNLTEGSKHHVKA